jgi:hypothetical protein
MCSVILFQERGNIIQEKEKTKANEEGIMRINYPKAIGESEEDLISLEQRLRGQKAADRVRRWSATARSR